MYDGECKVFCLSGFFGDKDFKECKFCDDVCSSCVGFLVFECVSCFKGFFRFGILFGICVVNCFEGKFCYGLELFV